MKKKLLLMMTVMAMTITVSAFAQQGDKSIGLNLGYGTEIKSIGIGAKFNYNITDPIQITPSLNYFIKKDGLSEWEINADAHYLFQLGEKFYVYPLLGLTFQIWKFDWNDAFGFDDDDYYYYDDEDDEDDSSSVTRFGINIGGGIQYEVTPKIVLNAEFKYSIVSDFDQAVISIGAAYKF